MKKQLAEGGIGEQPHRAEQAQKTGMAQKAAAAAPPAPQPVGKKGCEHAKAQQNEGGSDQKGAPAGAELGHEQSAVGAQRQGRERDAAAIGRHQAHGDELAGPERGQLRHAQAVCQQAAEGRGAGETVFKQPLAGGAQDLDRLVLVVEGKNRAGGHGMRQGDPQDRFALLCFQLPRKGGQLRPAAVIPQQLPALGKRFYLTKVEACLGQGGTGGTDGEKAEHQEQGKARQHAQGRREPSHGARSFFFHA